MEHSVETSKRVVVEGRWDGDLLPGTMAELNREVIVRPGSTITGGVFGRVIRIQGPASFKRAVYATEEIEIEATGEVRFESSLGCRNILTVSSPDSGGHVAVAGDINVRNAQLERCVVRGSVHADTAHLSHCLVFGVLHARESVELLQTIALTVDGQSVRFGCGCGIILPYARASKDLTLDEGVRLVAFPTENNVLGESDVITGRRGTLHLTGGCRLTNLLETGAHLTNLKNFISRVALDSVLGSRLDEIDYTVEALPDGFRRWVDAGAMHLHENSNFLEESVPVEVVDPSHDVP